MKCPECGKLSGDDWKQCVGKVCPMRDNKPTDKEINEATNKFIDMYAKDVWNAAIDKCIEVANKYDSYGPAYEMRMLKK